MSWQIDYGHSEIQFSARHLMVSTVRGGFDRFTGTIDLDEQNPANTKVAVQIEATSLNSGFRERDDHLRSPDFLDAENYPYLTFTSKGVELLDASHARLSGNLTIRDVTREVTLDVEFHGQVKNPFGPFVTAGFSARTKINRKAWGLTWNAALETGGVAVGEEITIDIRLELTKELEAQEQAPVGEMVAT